MQKIRKRKKTKALLFKLALLFLAGVIAIQLISLQHSIYEKQKQLTSLENQVSEQAAENQRLQQQINEGVTDEYIEKVAREQLGYVSPFERVFVDVTGE